MNVLVGDNGAGKTSVLEAMLVLAKGKSFRTGQIGALIGPDSGRFLVSATLEGSGGKKVQLGIERSEKAWRARRNGVDCRQIGQLAAELPLVLLEPNSHDLVAGPPEGRRRYLDWSVFHVEQDYLGLWRRYARAVKQRNAALRASDARLLDGLDEQVAKFGEKIHRLRSGRSSQLADLLPARVSALGSRVPPVALRYQQGWAGESLHEALARSREKDLERGVTGAGPHRADLVFEAGGHPARDSLSRGEQKLLAAALLLTQAGAIAESGVQPVFLLDDLASEFDAGHREAVLAACLETGAQTWVTGTTLTPLAPHVGETGRVFHVEHGHVARASVCD